MDLFRIEEMVAIIEGKQKAYSDILKDAKSGDTDQDVIFYHRMKAKKQVCDELLKEYNARK